jgi:uncharacterized protein
MGSGTAVASDPALDRLEGLLEPLHAAVVAFSGGVDSTLLAAAAHRVLGDRAVMVTGVSPALAARDLERAVGLARENGWRHELVTTAELDREGYRRNQLDRCFWCKTELFSHLAPIAERVGGSILVGTNADDLTDHRPGRRAASQAGALTPLADAALTKDEVRRVSRLLNLPTADQPASPCLASRLAYGIPVTTGRLGRVEAAEAVLLGCGFTTLRVRDHGDLARIEVPLAEIARLTVLGGQIAPRLQELGFQHVTCDLQGFRSGSLNPPSLTSAPAAQRSQVP